MSTTVTEAVPVEPQYEYFYRDHSWDNKREVLVGEKAVETFDEIPLIDIGGIFSRDFNERRRVADEVAEVCKTVGFFYIKGHGISQDLIDEIFELNETYHAQPHETKMNEYVYKSKTLRGYDEHYTDSSEGRKLKKESWMYSYNPDHDPQPPNLTPEQREECIGIHNLWPTTIPGFEAKCLEYFAALLKLSRCMMRTFALGLGAEETYFDDIITTPYISIILQHYPPRPAGAKDLDGLGAHSDFETFTILNQDMVGGLEVLNKNGVYIPAKPIRGTFVVNIGDFLQRISNDTFVSTVHRVRNTSGKERYSMPFFFAFNPDANVEVMPACTSDINPAKYGPRNLREYTARRRALQKEAHDKGELEDALV